MKGARLVVLAGAGLAIAGLTLVLAVRAARGSSNLRAFLAARFTPRPDCQAPDPFIETDVDFDCFDGRLDSGRPVGLILGRGTSVGFVGIWLPAGADLGEAWWNAWRDRVRARGDWWGRRAGGPPRTHILVGPSEAEPVRVDRLEGGVLIAWRLVSLPSREKVEARLVEVEASLGR